MHVFSYTEVQFDQFSWCKSHMSL